MEITSAVIAAAAAIRDVKVEDFEPSIEKFTAQAEELYDDWPLAA